MNKIEALSVRFQDKPVGSLAFTPDNRLCTFEYNKSWIAEGFSISPLELPLKEGMFIAKPIPFYGNFGIFEDSLPDGYGRYLLHRTLLRNRIDDTSLSSLDRLAIVGDNGMGALSYSPAIRIEQEKAITDLDLLQHKALEVLREKSDNEASLLLYNSGNSGGARPKAIFTDSDGHWLVKFRHTYDPADIGIQEYRYNITAQKCGITVPDSKLFNGRYFASRRFDIDSNGNRIHTASAGALLGISLREPFLDYSNLLALTGYLTQNTEDVEQMYRRMVFNYLTENKDDHCKNFSFYVLRHHNTWQWRLAPAYDLTLCKDGYNGEHATSVNGTGTPRLEDFIAVGTKIKLPAQRCRIIIDEVCSGCRELTRYKLSH